MPGFNQRGPAGTGAMTGRGRGICRTGRETEAVGYDVVNETGAGRGRGRGLGLCRRVLGPGQPAAGLCRRAVVEPAGPAAKDLAPLEEQRQKVLEELARIEVQIAGQSTTNR